MFKKIGAFFASFFQNIAADPVSSAKGLTQLASAGSACYCMAIGTVPINQLSIMAAIALAASGIHALGTNLTGVTLPAVATAETALEEVSAAVPVALSIADQVAAMQKEAEAGQGKVDAFATVAAALASIIPTPAPAPPEVAAPAGFQAQNAPVLTAEA